MQQANRENTLHEVVRFWNRESGRLKRLNTACQNCRSRLQAGFEHGRIEVRSINLPLRLFSEQFPEASRPAWEIQHRRRIAGNRQGPSRHPSFAPGVQPAPEPALVLVERSEERRVGKECRALWSRDPET